jgi:hypothetical protein
VSFDLEKILESKRALRWQLNYAETGEESLAISPSSLSQIPNVIE